MSKLSQKFKSFIQYIVWILAIFTYFGFNANKLNNFMSLTWVKDAIKWSLWVSMFWYSAYTLYLTKKKIKKDNNQKINEYFQNKENIPVECGVGWDDKQRMICTYCGNYLKNSSSNNPSILHCSNPTCDEKFVLKDNHGNFLTRQQAFDIAKNKKIT